MRKKVCSECLQDWEPNLSRHFATQAHANLGYFCQGRPEVIWEPDPPAPPPEPQKVTITEAEFDAAVVESGVRMLFQHKMHLDGVMGRLKKELGFK